MLPQALGIVIHPGGRLFSYKQINQLARHGIG